MTRPEFCEEVKCPHYRYGCRVWQEIVRVYPRRWTQTREKGRLIKEAREDPQILINKCAQTLDS